MMQVLERFNLSKTGKPDSGEDIVFVGEHFAAVIDGVTSAASFGSPGGAPVTSGRAAAELIRDAMALLPREVSATEAFPRLDAAIRDFYSREGILAEAERDRTRRCGAVVIVYSVHRRQLWRVGDCQALVDGRDWPGGKQVDALLSELRAFFLETELRRGKTVEELLARDTGRELIRDLLLRQQEFQNAGGASRYDYQVMDGFFRSPAEVEVLDLPPGTRELALASDGYPVLRPSLAETEAELARVIREDPLCFRLFRSTKGVYPGNVSFDDRSYLKIRPA